MTLPFEQLKRKIITKKKSATDKAYGCNPEERPVENLIEYGVINLNKPKGPTSHQVADFVQRILHIKKAGHSGTLDPAVTGVLPIALGKSTRILQTLLTTGKEYVCILHLHKDFPQQQIKKVMKQFVGKIKQLPPIKSAVKRRIRERQIYYIDILEIEKRDVLFRVGCEAGTYIRKLCHDIGEKIGSNAHMSKLVRTQVGPFTDKEMITLQDLADAYAFWKENNNEKFIRHCIKPVEFAIKHVPHIWVMDNAVDTLCHGASLKVPGIVKLHDQIQTRDIVAVLTLKGELICLCKAAMNSEQMLKEDRGLAAEAFKVFMELDTYPKYTKQAKNI